MIPTPASICQYCRSAIRVLQIPGTTLPPTRPITVRHCPKCDKLDSMPTRRAEGNSPAAGAAPEPDGKGSN